MSKKTILFLLLFAVKLCAADNQLCVTPQCAQYCVHHCCALLGVPVSLRQVCDLLPPKDKGESFLEMGNILEHLGLKCTAVEASLDELLEGSFPVIAHVNSKRGDGQVVPHFIVIETTGSYGLKVKDGYRRGVLSKEVFADIWSGYILRIEKSKEPKIKGNRPAIQFKTLFIDAGYIPQAEDSYPFTFSVTNTGNADLNISKVKTNCGCTLVNNYPHILAAGETGQIVINYTFGKSRGVFNQSAVLMSDDPDYPAALLTMTGNGKQDVKISPAVFNFGGIVEGEKAVARCFVTYSGDNIFLIESAETNQKALNLTVNPFTPKLLNEKLFIPFAQIIPSNCTNRFIIEASLDTNELKTTNSNNFVEIKTNLPDAKELKIPVSFEMISPISITPTKLFLGEVVAGTSISENIMVKSLNGSTLEVNEIDLKDTGLKCTYKYSDSDIIKLYFTGQILNQNQIEGKKITIILRELGSNKSFCIELPISGLIKRS